MLGYYLHENRLGSASESRKMLNIFLLLALFFNCLFLFFDANWGDVGFWREWTRQLVSGGYANFDGNYPPVYVHWLYFVSRVYSVLGLDLENSLFLKFMSILPVVLGHLLLVYFLHKIAWRGGRQSNHYNSVMLLAALNPALLLDGPVWGQIDVLPVLPIVAALALSVSKRFCIFTMPLAFFALLTKFQMIAFAPVFGVIFFRNIKIHLMGGALCVPVFLIIYSPFIINGVFSEAFYNAYIHVLNQYSATTMGASNIWILLTGNAAPDSIVLFGISEDSIFSHFFRAKNFGMLLFVVTCLVVFLQGMQRHVVNYKNETADSLLKSYVFYAMLCAIAFFTFLPAMHERYLIPAVVMGLTFYAVSERQWVFPALLTFVSGMNLLMTLGIKTNSVWPIISWVCLFVCVLAVADMVWPPARQIFRRKIEMLLVTIGFAPAVMTIVLVILGVGLYRQVVIMEPILQENQVLLTSIPIVYSQQDYGNVRVNKSNGGSTLTVGHRRYAYGFGVHAESTLEFDLPPGVTKLDFGVGVDDEVESASVRFVVIGNGEELWRSESLFGREATLFNQVDISGVQRLELKVDSLGGIQNDHADWLNPVITIEAGNP